MAEDKADIVELEGSGDSEKQTPKAKNLLQDPLALAALQAEHQRESHTFWLSLTPAVRRRVLALKKLQANSISIEAEFYRKVHDIECEYAKRFKELYDKRSQVVSGNYEPNEEECDFKTGIDDLPVELKEKLNVANGPDGAKEPKGIPEFWLTLFKNTDIIAEMIQEHDEPILKHLADVECKISPDPMSFTLLFHFTPNEFFTNSVLTKEYYMKCQPDDDDPFEFDGPEIIRCQGSKIDWKNDKNVTIKKIKKKQKHKSKGATRFVTKEVKTDSFFNFFDPPKEEEDMDEETKELLNADFEIGQILRDRIVPRAVLYYTGEAHDEEDEFDEDEDEEEEYGSDDMDEDDDEDDHPKGTSPADKSKPQECNQQ